MRGILGQIALTSAVGGILGLFNMHFVNFWLARSYILMNRFLEETKFIGYKKV